MCSICIAGWPWPVLVVSVLWAYNNHIQWKSCNVDTIGTAHAYDYLVYEGVRGFHLNFFMYGNTHWLSVQHGHISAALALCVFVRRRLKPKTITSSLSRPHNTLPLLAVASLAYKLLLVERVSQ